jgi:Ser/Thr protein kinase RdoA (MazF antagonist)
MRQEPLPWLPSLHRTEAGVQRRPDVDQQALHAMLRPVLGPEFSVARTPAGVAAQVYRVQASGRVVYMRIAEDDEDLSVDAALLEHLAALGLHVPEVVHVERFNQALGRSVLIMGEVAGEPLAGCREERAARRVARAAGRELAVLNGVGGGLRLGPAPAAGLAAARHLRDLRQVRDLLPARPVAGAAWGAVQRRGAGAAVGAGGPRTPPRPAGATLAHGDFDTTAIFQRDGDYSGLIDFGEIRGTEPLFDLAHFHLWEHQRTPAPLWDALLAGYGEVAALPAGYEERVGRSATLLGLRQLARWLGPPRNLGLGHPMVTGRVARLRQLLSLPGIGPAEPPQQSNHP